MRLQTFLFVSLTLQLAACLDDPGDGDRVDDGVDLVDAGGDSTLDGDAGDAEDADTEPDAPDATGDGPNDADRDADAARPRDGVDDGDAGHDANDSRVDADGSGSADLPVGSVACDNAPIPRGGTACLIDEGTSDWVLLRGTILTPGAELENGHLLFERDGDSAVIACAACDCSSVEGFDTATVVSCADSVVSPGLINPHDHISFNTNHPTPHGTERYEHRHDWRTGRRGHTELNARSDLRTEAIQWNELRHLMAGTTSIVGSGGTDGIVRNLDRDQEELGQGDVNNQTFPLGDSGGTLRNGNCTYPDIIGRDEMIDDDSFLPHISEGIDHESRNELLCTTTEAFGGEDIVEANTGIVHGISLNARDAAEISLEGATVIWSLRSNIDLYGNTAPMTLVDTLGGRVAISTDWTPTGSMNLLREMKCVDSFNTDHLGGYFSDQDIFRMATEWAAAVTATRDAIGILRPGRTADIAIFAAAAGGGSAYRAVIDADPEDVQLVLRGGVALYGDANIVSSLADSPGECEIVDVCGVDKRLCLEADIGSPLSEVERRVGGDPYGLFFCGTPDDEPTCTPSRPGEYDGSTGGTDRDGDGRPNASDNCPDIFNPVRPMDDGVQADFDDDGVGDVCDPCPLEADTEECEVPDPDDRDGDGISDVVDNCPLIGNPGQRDRDEDLIGDPCDLCPTISNLDGSACPFSISEVRDPTNPDRPTFGDRVRIESAVVTAVQTHRANNFGFYAQEAGAPDWGGILVYTRNDIPTADDGTVLMPGMEVALEGSYIDFSGIAEISLPTSIELLSTGSSPVPRLVTPTELGETTENLLVSIDEVVSVTYLEDPPGTPGNEDEFWVSRNASADCDFGVAGCALVGDFLFDGGDDDNDLPATVLGREYSAVTGLVNGFADRYSIDIRDLDDLEAR